MILTAEQLKSVLRGVNAARVDENGCLCTDRYTPSQREVIQKTHDRNLYQTTGERLDFYTDADALSMTFRYQHITSRIFMSIDVYEDGVMIGGFREVNAFDRTGDSFRLPFEKKGKKRVTVYLPYTLELVMDRVELEGGSYVEPFDGYRGYVYFIGDSITHGFDAEYTSYCYVSAAARQLSLDFLNQGIGGYTYNAASLGTEPIAHKPDAIVVAYGTNDWAGKTKDAFLANIEEFYARLTELYPGIPVLCVTPVWRSGHYRVTQAGRFDDACEAITETALRYGANVVDGWRIIPHSGAFFRDLRLHPNDLGFASYAAAVADALRTLLPFYHL